MAEIRGRHTDNPAKNVTLVRLTDAEREQLEYCSAMLGTTKSDIIRRGIQSQYDELTKTIGD